MLLVGGAHDNPGFFQTLQTIREGVRWDSLGRCEEFAIGALAAKYVPDDQERPSVADQVESVGNRAGGASKVARLVHVCFLRSRGLNSHLHIASRYATVSSDLHIASHYLSDYFRRHHGKPCPLASRGAAVYRFFRNNDFH